jgi:hypothetical protein
MKDSNMSHFAGDRKFLTRRKILLSLLFIALVGGVTGGWLYYEKQRVAQEQRAAVHTRLKTKMLRAIELFRSHFGMLPESYGDLVRSGAFKLTPSDFNDIVDHGPGEGEDLDTRLPKYLGAVFAEALAEFK